MEGITWADRLDGEFLQYEDFTSVKRYFKRLERCGISDFRTYFRRHPGEVIHCASLIKKQTSPKEPGSSNTDKRNGHIIYYLAENYDIDPLQILTEVMIALAEGKDAFQCVVPFNHKNGERHFLVMKVKVVPENCGLLQTIASCRGPQSQSAEMRHICEDNYSEKHITTTLAH